MQLLHAKQSSQLADTDGKLSLGGGGGGGERGG